MSHVQTPEAFNPPVNRSMKVLDRSFFKKTIPTTAATILDQKKIATIRNSLSKSRESLHIGALRTIFDDETTPGARCLLLDPNVKVDEPDRWSPTLTELVQNGTIKLRKYDLELSYDDFNMGQILDAILPDVEDDGRETPTGFSQIGHVAHLNLRSQYLPYKYLIGEVLADKAPTITTVINKTFDVGSESIFRTFPYEVLTGPDDLNVTVSESGCEFQFDFAKVYWNSRLSTEHERIISKFKPGEAVCDVMAGVGPFALPAGKRHVFVRANDLNPDCFASLTRGIVRNKVAPFVLASCADGRAYIREETQRLRESRRTWLKPPPTRSRKSVAKDTPKTPDGPTTLVEPAVFGHYVMNLPATAVEFLDEFQGIYHGREAEFAPNTESKLPMIHVYTFQAKKEKEEEEIQEVCQKVSQYLGAKIDTNDKELNVEVHNVRLVSPMKWMYCASFRLPASVAFAKVP